jgi:phospholipase/carboxylesterase
MPASPYENGSIQPVTFRMTGWYALAPEIPPEDPCGLLLVLHGYGQTAGEFLEAFLPLAGATRLVAAAQGPHAFYHKGGRGRIGFSWMTSWQRKQAIVDVNNYLQTVLDDILARHPVDPGRIAVLGFSQGGPAALRFALSSSRLITRVIVCASDIPAEIETPEKDFQPVFRLLYGYGREDPLLSTQRIEDSVERLVRCGIPHHVCPYDGGHEIAGGLIEKIRAWLDPGDSGYPAD